MGCCVASTDELINSIEDSLKYLCELRGYDADFVKTATEYVSLKLCQRFQGDQIRIKKPPTGKPKRNQSIKKMYNGRNMSAVCERFGITPSTVYRVIKRKHKNTTKTVTQGGF